MTRRTTHQGQLVMSYPSPARKARLFAVFWAIFSAGGLVGGRVEATRHTLCPGLKYLIRRRHIE